MASDRQFISRAQAQGPFYVGIDLGGTNIKAGVVDDLGRSLSWHSIPTNPDNGPEDGAKRMGQLALAVIEMAGLTSKDIARAGLGSPGTMDIPKGMLLEPPNLHVWQNFPIVSRVEHHCGLPLTFANDADAAAYGEFWVGSGRDFDSLVMFTLGTGIGCGIIVHGTSIVGENSHGAECGHIIIDYHENARLCPCGQTGHLEAYASATAVTKRTEEAIAAGRRSTIAKRIEAGEEFTPRMLDQEAEKGDALALELILDTAMYLGVGMVNLMHTIDPTGVILGGAMTFGGHETAIGRQFLDRVKQEVHKRAFPVPAQRVKIDYAALGGDAGYIGAAGLARVAHRQKTM
ncbi:MAG: ROK family protein [Planctomycetales bacterium]|nr:ROK family protein [Planctomycetales bacterium]